MSARPSSSAVTLREFITGKGPSVMADGDVQMGEAQSKKAMASLWVSDVYGDLVRGIEHLGGAVADLRRQKQDPRAIAPVLARALRIGPPAPERAA